MLDSSTRFEANTAEITAKVIDGEAIIINLSTGVYYTITGNGDTWTALSDGYNASEIAEQIAHRYDVTANQAEQDIMALIAQLKEENIIKIKDRTPATIDEHHLPAEKQAYEKPELQIYRDMGDLLALDPPMPSLEDIPWQGTGKKDS